MTNWHINYNQEGSDLSLEYAGPGQDAGLQGWVIFNGG
eukprot:CAMPEP_0172913526 /NCGR_PEP_ID=MMETSP1075-20121228/190548_1 /TAXON_ID=2916 /ORGANISM="Ceratium fusus, Strain PA161109" /LENGTH=37 /DNA_ID= /DNA_START= /DNA_END= /DNA_ORIENTATION=